MAGGELDACTRIRAISQAIGIGWPYVKHGRRQERHSGGAVRTAARTGTAGDRGYATARAGDPARAVDYGRGGLEGWPDLRTVA